MNSQELYLFNPFTIEKAAPGEIAETYTKLQEKIIDDTDLPYQIANNIEVYANMNFLLAEMISRLQEEFDTLKVKKDIEENNSLYEERNKFIQLSNQKPPAIDYFRAIAREKVKDEYEQLAKLGARLGKFKKIYDSIESKQNALKFKIKSIDIEK